MPLRRTSTVALAAATLAVVGGSALVTSVPADPGGVSAPASRPSAGVSATPGASPSPTRSPGLRAAAAPSASPSAGPTAAPKLSTKAATRDRFLALATAYNSATQPIVRASTKHPIDLAGVRAAAPQAVTAYNKWLAGLRGTRWPSDVQPLVDRYLKLSPVGLKTLQRLQRVTTVDELMTPGDPAGLKSLSRAEAALRDKVL